MKEKIQETLDPDVVADYHILPNTPARQLDMWLTQSEIRNKNYQSPIYHHRVFTDWICWEFSYGSACLSVVCFLALITHLVDDYIIKEHTVEEPPGVVGYAPKASIWKLNISSMRFEAKPFLKAQPRVNPKVNNPAVRAEVNVLYVF